MYKIYLTSTFYLLILFVGISSCQAQQVDDSKKDKILDLIETVKLEHELVGLSVTVWHKGAFLINKAYGYANLEDHIPVEQGKTQFQVASLTKLFTGILVLKLVENGKLDLDDKVAKYIPSFNKERKKEITIRMLIDHTGGIRTYYQGERDSIFLSKHYDTTLDAISIFKNDSLVADPGIRMLYTSYGYNLLAAVCEVVSNQPYDKLIKEVLFDPLKLENTCFGNPGERIEHEVTSYSFYKNDTGELTDTLRRTPRFYDYSYNMGGGNILTTTEDLVKLGKAVLSPGYFTKESLDVFYTPGTNAFGEVIDTGFGVFIFPDEEGRKRIYTTGAIYGNQAGFQLYPEERLIISVASNTWGKGENRNEVVRHIPVAISNLVLNE